MRHLLAATIIVLALATVAAPAGAESVTVEASGACNPQSDGASDSASVTVNDGGDVHVVQPDPDNVEAAVVSCAEDGASGSQPGPGSHLTVTVYHNGEVVESVSTDDILP